MDSPPGSSRSTLMNSLPGSSRSTLRDSPPGSSRPTLMDSLTPKLLRPRPMGSPKPGFFRPNATYSPTPGVFRFNSMGPLTTGFPNSDSIEPATPRDLCSDLRDHSTSVSLHSNPIDPTAFEFFGFHLNCGTKFTNSCFDENTCFNSFNVNQQIHDKLNNFLRTYQQIYFSTPRLKTLISTFFNLRFKFKHQKPKFSETKNIILKGSD